VIFFTFVTPTNPLLDLKIGEPQGALALATAAESLEWNKGTLSLKLLQENDTAKFKKSLKYYFSYAN
jgi:hypothetical protein